MTRMRTGSSRRLAAFLAGVAGLLAVAGAAGVARAGTAQATPGPRAVWIVLDTNRSMARTLPAERESALDYSRALPADVDIGLITFNIGWQVALSPTADRKRLATALATAHPLGDNSNGLYGAVSAAASMLDQAGSPARDRLLVISDAEDLTGPVVTATIPTDAVIWRIDGDDRVALLRTLASVAGGHVADPAGTASLAAGLFEPGASPAAPSASRPGGAGSRARWSRSLIVVLAVVFTALLVTALLVIGSMRRPAVRQELAAMIERYGSGRASTQGEVGGRLARAMIGWMRRFLRSTSTERRLAARLDLAGTARQSAEWALMGFCAAAVLAAVLSLVTRNGVIGVPFGALIGWLAMRLILSIRIGRRRAAFGEQLPDVLQLVASSLQSGFSLEQSLDAVVREDAQPAAGEFSRALAETRIGADIATGLEGVANRMASTDLRWAVMAIRIQREVGGNLAEVLRNTVDTMRERTYIRRHVKALSAEGRFSAYILGALPIAVSGWIFLTAKAYTRPLYTTSIGLVMVSGAAVLFLLGVLWLRAVIKVEV